MMRAILLARATVTSIFGLRANIARECNQPLALRANRVRLAFEIYLLGVARRELRRGTEPVAVEPQVFDLLQFNPDLRDLTTSLIE
jgi:hypothetical protein